MRDVLSPFFDRQRALFVIIITMACSVGFDDTFRSAMNRPGPFLIEAIV
jgi:hypothetical protein